LGATEKAGAKVGETVDQYFLVKRKDLRRTRSYDEFINVVLTDVSGDIRGKIWKEKIHLALRNWIFLERGQKHG